MMENELEIKTGNALTGSARAGCGALDIDLPIAKCEIGGLDQLQDSLSAGDKRFLGISKDRIPLEFVNGQEFFDLHTDRFEQIAQNFVGMVELCPCDKRGIARDIGKKQITVLGDRAHGLIFKTRMIVIIPVPARGDGALEILNSLHPA
jgi:hypothetical protein